MRTNTIPDGYTITRRVRDDGDVSWRATAPNGRSAITVYRREAIEAAQAHARSGGLRWS